MREQKKDRSPAKGNGLIIGNRRTGTRNVRNNRTVRKTVQPAHHFSGAEKRQIIQAASSQEDAIRLYFHQHPGRKHHYQDVMDMFHFRESSTKRAMTNLSNSRPSGPWVDQNGEPPLLKLTEKRLNKDTGIRIALYKWNDRYGQPKEDTQTDLFPPDNSNWGV